MSYRKYLYDIMNRIGLFVLLGILHYSCAFRMSQLNFIIRLRVIKNEIVEGVLSEIKEDRMFINLIDFQFEPRSYICSTLFLLFLYSSYKYKNEKNKLAVFEKKEIHTTGKLVRELVFIFLLVFAKQVDTAY